MVGARLVTRVTVVALLALTGCTAKVSGPTGTCSATGPCPNGETCLDNVCVSPCEVSCGGACAPCGDTGEACTKPSDCTSNTCASGVCQQLPSCGNGLAEGPEVCDGSDFSGQTCVNLGFDGGGSLGCSALCDAVLTSGCTTSEVCGDNTKAGPEMCDGTDLGGMTCVLLGYEGGGTLSCLNSCAGYDTAGCSSGAVCGDNTKEGPETCDGTDLGGTTCTSLGYNSGTLACLPGCGGFDASGCNVTEYCGDATRQGAEACDGVDLNGATCTSLGYSSGTLGCTGQCAYDITGCNSSSVCGDGTRQGAETCDGADLAGQTCMSRGFDGGTLACTGGCAFDESACYLCGDNQAGGIETCDGSDLNGATCTSRGFTSGILACSSGCNAYDETGCGTCPNGAIDGGELCDGAMLGGATCASQGYDSGNLACAVDCQSYDVTGCGNCGDGSQSGAEDCDGTDLNGATCASRGYTTGTLSCDGGCNYDETLCTTCGDNTREGSEVCDGTDLDGQDCTTRGYVGGTLACDGSCAGFVETGCTQCGNNTREGSEVCDGTDVGTETCTTQTGLNHGALACAAGCGAYDTSMCSDCGNNSVAGSEVCDGSDLNGATCVSQGFPAGGVLNCDGSCDTFDTSGCYECGNGRIDPGEQCDDANGEDRDNCRNDCTLPVCGDAFASALATGVRYEGCDDGNANDLDDCRNSCRLPFCGDFVASTDATGALHEDCDDGANDGSYGTCMPDCTLAPYCGDTVITAPYEECDDGINDGTYGTCRSDCRFAPDCGDGQVNTPPEACDDNDTTGGDGCSADCLTIETGWFCPTPGADCLPACGNNRFDSGESCDDGGRCADSSPCEIGGPACADLSTCAPAGGDGCSDTCTIEPDYACPRFGQACHPLCGNGFIDGSEICDDAGLCDDDATLCKVSNAAVDCAATPLQQCTTRSGDGCNATCSAVEPLWECPIVGQPCNLICGNGRIDGAEECDLGGLNVDGQYNGCNTDCTLGPRCSDGTVDTADGEECDLGPGNNTGAYGGCRADCTWAVHCGDGALSAVEECEDGGLCNDDTTSCSGDAVCQAVVPDPSWQCTGRSGDGCSDTCVTEAGYVCRNPGAPCELLALCGNGVLDGTEQCDDGGMCDDNVTPCTSDAYCQLENPAWTCTPQSGDGCDDTCSTFDPGWFCPTPGESCTATNCGDGLVAGYEQCDDGNTNPGDGCSDRCELEPSAIVCGNGIREGTEECDDYNTSDLDGCSSTCALENDYVCFPTPNVPCGSGSGQGNCPCTPMVAVCGDGTHQGGEECDDGQHCGDVAHTECSSDAQCESLLNSCASRCGNLVCELGECGTCPSDCPSQCFTASLPNCGNGSCGGSEDASNCASDCGSRHCGDMNFTPCSNDATCTALPQTDYPCTTRAGDGCGPTCLMEPMFECFPDGAGEVCRPSCGDGRTLVAVGEECDDGNLTSGDGCSTACKIESGYTCTDLSGLPATIDIDMTFRDFRGLGDNDGDADGSCTSTAGADGYPTDTSNDPIPLSGAPWSPRYCGHYDFEHYACGSETTGLVRDNLSPSGKPEMNWSCDNGTDAVSCVTDADCTAASRPTPCAPARRGTGGCGFGGGGSGDQLTDPTRFSQWYVDTTNVNRSFDLPLTMSLLDAPTRSYQYSSSAFFPLSGVAGTYGNTPTESNNFSFTSEWRTFFQYNGGETLQFSGDDDVWVFINGILAVDLGGLHPPRNGSVTLANSIDPTLNIKTDSRFDIYEKGVYEITFFHAERHTTGSNFTLTLSGFLRTDISTCSGICGNGIAQLGEECDDGNTTPGDGCSDTCTLEGAPPAASCGNQVLDTGEECDDGNGDDTDLCTTTCTNATCGDGFTQPAIGEVCDDGINNGNYGYCVVGCVAMGPHCGDGSLNGTEECDDGVNDGAYGTCAPDCTLANYCGDADPDLTFEECDAGTANNDGQPPERCNPDCTLNAVCGDGFVDAFLGEACDNGVANDDLLCGGCKTNCQWGPRCGDGIVNCGETCDDGTNSGAYGGCEAGCAALGPYCGDGTINGTEACDDGTAANNGTYGQCNPDCTLAARCGDGYVDGGFEQCDLGTAGNTGAYGTCNSDCTFPDYCGDSVVNGSEDCDDGVNNGDYNTCNPDCSWPERCGDATLQDPPEQCDDGTNNTVYGPGCRSNCTTPPACGDGTLQSLYEQCDSNILGGKTCNDLNGNGVTGEPGDFEGGTLSCDNGTCTLNTSACYACGDGTKNGAEDCDGIGQCGGAADCGGETCMSLGFPETTGLGCDADCNYDLSGCDVSTCGNGAIDAGEQCDPTAPSPVGTRACDDLDGDGNTGEPGDFNGGTLACGSGCTLDTSGCHRCGDGVKNGSELCDGSDTGGETCLTIPGGYQGGTLTCNSTCDNYDTSGCWECTSCNDCGGQACDNHQCGACTTSADCCAPLTCFFGTCTAF